MLSEKLLIIIYHVQCLKLHKLFYKHQNNIYLQVSKYRSLDWTNFYAQINFEIKSSMKQKELLMTLLWSPEYDMYTKYKSNNVMQQTMHILFEIIHSQTLQNRTIKFRGVRKQNKWLNRQTKYK